MKFDSLESLVAHLNTKKQAQPSMATCPCGETYETKDGILFCWRCHPLD